MLGFCEAMFFIDTASPDMAATRSDRSISWSRGSQVLDEVKGPSLDQMRKIKQMGGMLSNYSE